MKRNICFFIGLMALSQTFAQSADSVKVRLKTSPGAEIAIDGDVSSTNLMTKRVPVGQHTVTVTYGTKYTKDHTINVTPSDTEFEFLLDGKLTVNSLPTGHPVYIDGIQQGRTPLTLPLLGDHNLRVEGDDMNYFDYSERVSVSPFASVERTCTLKKRPPRTYGMVLVNYEPNVSGVGLTLAIVKRWGMYMRLMSTPGANPNDVEHKPANGIHYFKEDKKALWNVSIGPIFRITPNIYAYGGAGYGEYSTILKPVSANVPSYSPYHSEGVLGEVGVILKYKALIGQVGYNMIFGESEPEAYKGLYLGLGITIHKNKKRK